MLAKFYTFLLAFLTVNFVSAQITVQDDDIQAGQTVTWSPDNGEYLLDGFVFVEEGATLIIEPGTVIKGKEVTTTGDNASALIIARDAQIIANGTARLPIIFTAEADDVNDSSDLGPDEKGLWGGVIILGNANITADACEKNIEGIPSTETRGAYGNCDNPNDDDNSGSLRFVSIRHGGAVLGAGNEINGLTLGGVGRGTNIEFVEVYANLDDGIEWFGGTVSVSNAAVSFCGDDAMDYDQGWSGKGQFWFVLVNEGDRGGEHDGAGDNDTNVPVSDPIIYNATYIGGSGSDAALFFADASAGGYFNSIFTEFNSGLFLEETGSDDFDAESNFLNEALELKNNIWWNNGSNTPADFITPNSQEVLDAFNLHNNTTENPQIASISYTTNGMLNPRPALGGAAYQDLTDIPEDDPFFISPNFKGAFGSGLWIRGWTALDANGHIAASPEIVIRDEDLEGGQTYDWTNDNTYLLDGFVFLEEGGKLNIEAGTIIKSTEVPSTGDNASALIIARGAQICAAGTADQPIIFTAQADDLSDASDLGPEDNGFWGGIIILGRAGVTADAPCKQIEGIPTGEPRALYGDCDGNSDDNDNSGFMRYVSIRHGGAALAPGNEINGLTLGGVGASTSIEFIEVMANFDDGIEWFGGTVSVKGAVVSHCGDDAMDYDQGWRGKGQYWVVFTDDNGDRGGEHDGAGGDDFNNPESDPQIYNATYIGSGGADRALKFRDGSSGRYANSIFTRYNTALEVEDTGDDFDSESNFLNGDLELLNNIFWDFGAGANPADLITPATPTVLAEFTATGNTLTTDPEFIDVPAVSEGNLTGNLDPRPSAGGAAGNDGSRADVPSDDDFYNEPLFTGAFCPNGVWINGWTAVSEYGVIAANIPDSPIDGDDLDDECHLVVGVEDLVIRENGYVLSQNTPNPAGSATQIAFELPKSTNASLVIFDIAGKVVATPVNNQNLQAGIHIIDVDLTDFQSGVYYYSLTNSEVTISKRLMVK